MRASLEEELSQEFKGFSTVTLRELTDSLTDLGFDISATDARVVLVMQRLGFTKNGDSFYKNTARRRSALVQIAPTVVKREAAPVPVPRTDFEDGEPRVRDVDFAAFLGFKQPRDIRKLIERHSASLGMRATVARTLVNGNTVEENWLTEHQCIYLAAKSETPIANSILQQVIDVFVKVRRGVAQVPASTTALTMAELKVVLEQQFQMFMQVIQTLRPELAPVAVEVQAPAPAPLPSQNVLGNWQRIWDWTEKRGLVLTTPERAKLGMKATQLLNGRGLEPKRNVSSKWKNVNSYPEAVISEAWGELRKVG